MWDYLSTSSVLWHLECTKLIFEQGSARDSSGSSQYSPDYLVGFWLPAPQRLQFLHVILIVFVVMSWPSTTLTTGHSGQSRMWPTSYGHPPAMLATVHSVLPLSFRSLFNRHRQLENSVANNRHSHTGKLNSVYFGPQTAKNKTGVLTHPTGSHQAGHCHASSYVFILQHECNTKLLHFTCLLLRFVINKNSICWPKAQVLLTNFKTMLSGPQPKKIVHCFTGMAHYYFSRFSYFSSQVCHRCFGLLMSLLRVRVIPTLGTTVTFPLTQL